RTAIVFSLFGAEAADRRALQHLLDEDVLLERHLLAGRRAERLEDSTRLLRLGTSTCAPSPESSSPQNPTTWAEATESLPKATTRMERAVVPATRSPRLARRDQLFGVD